MKNPRIKYDENPLNDRFIVAQNVELGFVIVTELDVQVRKVSELCDLI